MVARAAEAHHVLAKAREYSRGLASYCFTEVISEGSLNSS